MNHWYSSSIRRNLVDMHIEDWDPSFMSHFDPRAYVDLLKRARVQTAMVYANSHVGHCYWPTESGHVHAGLAGRDIFGELLSLCRAQGMSFVMYYSLIFNNWAHDVDQSWRMIDVDGHDSRHEGPGTFGTRYGVCCPNTGYRDFVHSQIDELAGAYAFDGVFFDMTFWPVICYCRGCTARFAAETGGRKIPTTVDWTDPDWIFFDEKRREWMAEFAEATASWVRRYRPNATVTHNGAPVTSFPWAVAADIGVLNSCDYLGADFYGGTLQQSFVCKYFRSTSKNLPFEYYTSVSDPDLNQDPVSIKNRDHLALRNAVSLAHGGAFLFIDAISPNGTLNGRVYDIMRDVFRESEQLEPYLGGTIIADVAIFFSTISKRSAEHNGKKPRGLDWQFPHLNSAVGAAYALSAEHVPFTVIGENNLDNLGEFQVVLLPGDTVLRDSEAATLLAFVRDGGSIYLNGQPGHESLASEFGIVSVDTTQERLTYAIPTSAGTETAVSWAADYPVTISGKQIVAKLDSSWTVLATIGLPYTDPDDTTRFASIHTNPPGRVSDHPAVARRAFGKGRVMWSAAPMESSMRDRQVSTFVSLIASVMQRSRSFSVTAPPVVEVLAMNQPDNERIVLHLLNEQDVVPPVPIHDCKLHLRVDPDTIATVTAVMADTTIEFQETDEGIAFVVPPFRLHEVVIVQYSK